MIAPGENTSPPTDSQLLASHLAGDHEAFGVLVRRYRRELFNFLARYTGDPALADDVFQETFLQLHISAATFDTNKRLKPWLFTIAANKAKDALRRRARKRAAPLDASIGGDQDERMRFSSLLEADVPSPDEIAANQETRQAVQEIVNAMPENLRIVLLLNYFHDLAYKEIADVLEVPLGTVKSRLHAAVKEFGNRWKIAAGRLKHDGSTEH